MKYKKGFYCRELEIKFAGYAKTYFNIYYWDGKTLEVHSNFEEKEKWVNSNYANFEALISVLKDVHENPKIALHYLGK